MSQEQRDTRTTGDLPGEVEGAEGALTALRNIWSATSQTSASIDESCGNTKACKSLDDVGFHGWASSVEETSEVGKPVGNSIRSAWRSQLEREGKLSANSGSVRDLVLGSKPKNE